MNVSFDMSILQKTDHELKEKKTEILMYNTGPLRKLLWHFMCGWAQKILNADRNS